MARLVDFPTPFTPTNTMVYGRPRSRAACASRRMSVLRLGVRIRFSASSIDARTVELRLVKDACRRPTRPFATDSASLGDRGAAGGQARRGAGAFFEAERRSGS